MGHIYGISFFVQLKGQDDANIYKKETEKQRNWKCKEYFWKTKLHHWLKKTFVSKGKDVLILNWNMCEVIQLSVQRKLIKLARRWRTGDRKRSWDISEMSKRGDFFKRFLENPEKGEWDKLTFEKEEERYLQIFRSPEWWMRLVKSLTLH